MVLETRVGFGFHGKKQIDFVCRLQEMNGLGSAENTYNSAHAFHQAPNNGYPCANPNAYYISRGNPFD